MPSFSKEPFHFGTSYLREQPIWTAVLVPRDREFDRRSMVNLIPHDPKCMEMTSNRGWCGKWRVRSSKICYPAPFLILCVYRVIRVSATSQQVRSCAVTIMVTLFTMTVRHMLVSDLTMYHCLNQWMPVGNWWPKFATPRKVSTTLTWCCQHVIAWGRFHMHINRRQSKWQHTGCHRR